MPEFLEKRFDSRSRWFLSIYSIVGYVLTKVSVTIYAGGVVISQLLGVSFLTGALTIVIVTGIYTVLGGMRAVVYTETLQTLVLILGAIVLTYMGFDAIGGWNELKIAAGSSHFDMWRPMSDPEYPWTGMVFGGAIVGIWYWCTDQYIVQRTLAANNIKIGRRGAIFGAYLKLLPIFIFLIPGIIAFALKQKGILSYERSDEVFPVLVATLLPTGIKGLVAGGLMAALMSSLASVFNSSSTLFTVDIFKKMYPDTAEIKLVQIGRIATGVVVILGMLWIPVMEKIGGGVLYNYLQSVQSYIAPPIVVVFVLGILWKRTNAQGAIATLFFGLIMATLRILAELLVTEGSGFIYTFASINFAHMAIFMFLGCLVVCVSVTMVTNPPEFKNFIGLAMNNLSEDQKLEAKSSFDRIDVIASLVLAVIIIGVLSYFTG